MIHNTSLNSDLPWFQEPLSSSNPLKALLFKVGVMGPYGAILSPYKEIPLPLINAEEMQQLRKEIFTSVQLEVEQKTKLSFENAKPSFDECHQTLTIDIGHSILNFLDRLQGLNFYYAKSHVDLQGPFAAYFLFTKTNYLERIFESWGLSKVYHQNHALFEEFKNQIYKPKIDITIGIFKTAYVANECFFYKIEESDLSYLQDEFLNSLDCKDHNSGLQRKKILSILSNEISNQSQKISQKGTATIRLGNIYLSLESAWEDERRPFIHTDDSLRIPLEQLFHYFAPPARPHGFMDSQSIVDYLTRQTYTPYANCEEAHDWLHLLTKFVRHGVSCMEEELENKPSMEVRHARAFWNLAFPNHDSIHLTLGEKISDWVESHHPDPNEQFCFIFNMLHKVDDYPVIYAILEKQLASMELSQISSPIPHILKKLVIDHHIPAPAVVSLLQCFALLSTLDGQQKELSIRWVNENYFSYALNFKINEAILHLIFDFKDVLSQLKKHDEHFEKANEACRALWKIFFPVSTTKKANFERLKGLEITTQDFIFAIKELGSCTSSILQTLVQNFKTRLCTPIENKNRIDFEVDATEKTNAIAAKILNCLPIESKPQPILNKSKWRVIKSKSHKSPAEAINPPVAPKIVPKSEKKVVQLKSNSEKVAKIFEKKEVIIDSSPTKKPNILKPLKNTKPALEKKIVLSTKKPKPKAKKEIKLETLFLEAMQGKRTPQLSEILKNISKEALLQPKNAKQITALITGFNVLNENKCQVVDSLLSDSDLTCHFSESIFKALCEIITNQEGLLTQAEKMFEKLNERKQVEDFLLKITKSLKEKIMSNEKASKNQFNLLGTIALLHAQKGNLNNADLWHPLLLLANQESAIPFNLLSSLHSRQKNFLKNHTEYHARVFSSFLTYFMTHVNEDALNYLLDQIVLNIDVFKTITATDAIIVFDKLFDLQPVHLSLAQNILVLYETMMPQMKNFELVGGIAEMHRVNHFKCLRMLGNHKPNNETLVQLIEEELNQQELKPAGKAAFALNKLKILSQSEKKDIKKAITLYSDLLSNIEFFKERNLKSIINTIQMFPYFINDTLEKKNEYAFQQIMLSLQDWLVKFRKLLKKMDEQGLEIPNPVKEQISLTSPYQPKLTSLNYTLLFQFFKESHSTASLYLSSWLIEQFSMITNPPMSFAEVELCIIDSMDSLWETISTTNELPLLDDPSKSQKELQLPHNITFNEYSRWKIKTRWFSALHQYLAEKILTFYHSKCQTLEEVDHYLKLVNYACLWGMEISENCSIKENAIKKYLKNVCQTLLQYQEVLTNIEQLIKLEKNAVN